MCETERGEVMIGNCVVGMCWMVYSTLLTKIFALEIVSTFVDTIQWKWKCPPCYTGHLEFGNHRYGPLQLLAERQQLLDVKMSTGGGKNYCKNK